MQTGEHVFQVPQGQGPTDHPALAGLDLGPLGTAYRGVSAGGIVVTRTMLLGFVAKDRSYGADSFPAGAYLRAQDKATGAVLAQIEVDRSLQGSPMTYMHEGRAVHRHRRRRRRRAPGVAGLRPARAVARPLFRIARPDRSPGPRGSWPACGQELPDTDAAVYLGDAG